MGSTVPSQSFGAIHPCLLAYCEQSIAQLCLLSSYTVANGSKFALLRVVLATTRLCNRIVPASISFDLDVHKMAPFLSCWPNTI